MNRQQFLQMLTAALADLPEQDRNRVAEFFCETIDDRMENGMTEEEAVAALGNPERIFSDIRQELGVNLPAPQKRSLKTFSSDDIVRLSFSEPVHTLRVETRFSDICIRPDPNASCITAEGPKDLEWVLQDGTLCLRCDPKNKAQNKEGLKDFLSRIVNWSFTGDSELNITVPEHGIHTLEITTVSGDATMNGFEIVGSVSFKGISGDFSAENLSINDPLNCTSTSGDLRLERIQIAGRLNASSTSGDVTLSCIEAASADLHTVSGDIHSDDCRFSDDISAGASSGDISFHRTAARSIAVHTASGDVDLDRTESGENTNAQSSSGDLNLREISAQSCWLKSASGSIHGTLASAADGYDFHCSSRSGSIRVPATRGNRLVEANTSSGSIVLDIQ